MGVVVDVEFDDDLLPEIYEALTVKRGQQSLSPGFLFWSFSPSKALFQGQSERLLVLTQAPFPVHYEDRRARHQALSGPLQIRCPFVFQLFESLIFSAATLPFRPQETPDHLRTELPVVPIVL